MKITKSIPAGIFIGIGAAVCSVCADPFIGAIMFATGLYLVCVMKVDLFTGKVGYITENMNGSYLGYLSSVWIGNLIGTVVFGVAMRYSKPELVPLAYNTTAMRLAQNEFTTAILSLFCGVLVHCAVYIYRETGQRLGILLCIPAFILCGFEHCVADMYTFTVAGVVSMDVVWHLLVVTIFNSLGAMLTNIFICPNMKHSLNRQNPQ